MFADLDALLSDFTHAARMHGVAGWPVTVTPVFLPAPHRPPALRAGCGAVYLFALGTDLGARAPAGAGAVLKVGKVGTSSGPRFSSQHYGMSARSTLARSLVKYRIMWPWLGIDHLDEGNVRAWMLQHLDRAHFLVPGGNPEVISNLELYVRARVGSVFEGSA